MLNNVALIYRRSGRQKAAEPYYLHALELYEKQLGPEHPDVAAILNNLGVFYTNERRFEEAEQMHQRALAIRRKANPSGQSDIAQSNCNLAVVYHARGDLTRAEELYRESMRGWENVQKPPEDYQIVASNYADLLRSLGKEAQSRGDRIAGAQKRRATPLIERLRSGRRRATYRPLGTLTWRNGRRVRLRTVWGNPWRFDSSREQAHQPVCPFREYLSHLARATEIDDGGTVAILLLMLQNRIAALSVSVDGRFSRPLRRPDWELEVQTDRLERYAYLRLLL